MLLLGCDVSWTTRIELPLKEEQASKDMSKKFDDVQPSLLLFLHRLRSITVEDEVCMYVRTNAYGD